MYQVSHQKKVFISFTEQNLQWENHWADLLLSTQPIHCLKFFSILLFFSFSLGLSFISRNFGLVVVIVLSNIIIQKTHLS